MVDLAKHSWFLLRNKDEEWDAAINIPCLSNDDHDGGENASWKLISRFLKTHRSF